MAGESVGDVIRDAVRQAFATNTRRGLQRQIARQLGVSESRVSRWASGALLPPEQFWSPLAVLLGLPHDHFVTVAEEAVSRLRTPTQPAMAAPTFANSLMDLDEREARIALAFVNEMRRLDAALEHQPDRPER